LGRLYLLILFIAVFPLHVAAVRPVKGALVPGIAAGRLAGGQARSAGSSLLWAAGRGALLVGAAAAAAAASSPSGPTPVGGTGPARLADATPGSSGCAAVQPGAPGPASRRLASLRRTAGVSQLHLALARAGRVEVNPEGAAAVADGAGRVLEGRLPEGVIPRQVPVPLGHAPGGASAARPATATSAAPGPASGGGIGVDVLKVRRGNAPPLNEYTKGCIGKARAMLRCKVARSGGIARLREDAFAKTTRASMASRWRTLLELADAGSFALVPATVETVELIAAALKAGGYRSGDGYLSALARAHRRAGHAWGPELQVARAEVRRSLERGLGPAKRARTVPLEDAVGVKEPAAGVAQEDSDFLIVGTAWLLRGAEAAALLGEQVSVSAGGTLASITLGATKTNPAGRDCKRTLRCSCTAGDPRAFGSRICPSHAAARILGRLAAAGLSSKHPLFPGRGGQALTADAARQAICRACSSPGMSEHSMRRMGAQFYARRGVPLAIIQHIGRWGSATVAKYVEHALEDRASWAPLLAAADLGPGPAAGGDAGASSYMPLCRSLLDGLVRRRVRAALRKERTRPPAGAAQGPAHPPPDGPSASEVSEQIAAVRAELGAQIAQVADRAGGALVAVRASMTQVGHLVRYHGYALHPSAWETHCGWKFAAAPHEPCSIAEVTCRRGCLSAARLVAAPQGRA